MSQCFEDVVFALISGKYGYGFLIMSLCFVVLLWCFGVCMLVYVRGGVCVCVCATLHAVSWRFDAVFACILSVCHIACQGVWVIYLGTHLIRI